MKKLGLGFALALGLTQATGCFSGHHGRSNLAAALWTAAAVGTVVHIAAHDAHHHWDSCGHRRHWDGGRWVYWSDGRWEYYDSGAGGWYVYR